ncbi:hypothetical protein MBLNU230_g7671t1 [Neophaeotheca triangularis]
MALKSPLMPSPTGAAMSSAFSPYTDSPNSPAPFAHDFHTQSNRSSGPSDSLAPPASPYPQQIEPSPVDSNNSNGTENTDIENAPQENEGAEAEAESPSEVRSPDMEIISPQSASSSKSVAKIDTQFPNRPRTDSSDDAPNSVIHAPSGFKTFEGAHDEPEKDSSATESSNTVASPTTPEAALSPDDKKLTTVAPVDTDVPAIADRSTPRAQTRQELEEEYKRKSRHSSSLEDIPESVGQDDDDDGQPSTAGLVSDGTLVQTMEALTNAEMEVAALRTALSECWTLCNTLAGLSSSHRQRTFKFAGKQEVQEQAWRSCWRLCQQLYDSRDEDHASQVLPTLELCRDFCQCLFEARQKNDEASDSVLRVSFELNNHLYNTHDRSLPEAFNERTLDFYITLCHRLMKQRTSLPQETDALLRACWSLAEMLFNIRQNTRDGKSADEELLGSAVQACWELCDLFREGWTQIRPDRGTPRPSQTSFPLHAISLATSGSVRSENARSNSSLSNRQYHDAPSLPPETPTTIFDDATTATSSPDSVNVPNILVLGPASTNSSNTSLHRAPTHHDRWSSNASILSGYSESAGTTSSSQKSSTSNSKKSQHSSSTATASSDDAHLARLRYLLLKAALDTGFTRSTQQLPTYVSTLPCTAFGTLPWQMKVLDFYRKLILTDKSMMAVQKLPSRRLGAAEVARSVRWLGRGEQWAWMRDLYRLVFGFGVEEAGGRGGSVLI